ncbi:MAG: hypothetical protein JWP97_3024 [Labilithrix sp.]|nr:hypothetical protein [Labilithrix sp.]
MKSRQLVLVASLLALAGCSSSGAATARAPDGGPSDAAPACVPISAASEKVVVQNDLGGLEGTLDVPEGCGPMPVVLILSGSGSTDRDGNAPGAAGKPAIYRVLAQAINDAGYATLRYDDPGIGKSANAIPAKVEDFRYEMEVHAAALFVAKLRTDARFGAVVAAGHSQGSLTGILAAAEQPIDGFVSLAGAGRPIGTLLREQVAPQLTAEQLAQLDAALAAMANGEVPGPLAPPLDSVLPAYVQPYMISWMKYDPRAEIAKLKGPVLLLQGKMDVQVQVLDAELLAQGRPDATTVLVDDMGHMLRKVTQKSAAAQAATYREPLPMHPAMVAALADFLGTLPKQH